MCGSTFLILTALAAPLSSDSMGTRARVLYERAAAVGLANVAQDPLLTRSDKDILRMMASLNADEITQAILGPEDDVSAVLRWSIRGGPQHPLRSLGKGYSGSRVHGYVPAYMVLFESHVPRPLDEVVVFYKRRDQDTVEYPLSVKPYPGMYAHNFVLGDCPSLESYAIGVFVDGLYIKIPAGKDTHITPENASQYHPWDEDPCSDTWVFELIRH